VFERFYRIDDPAVGPQPGTGLGLYISRELAERHGGSLVLAQSELGKGSTFVLTLPPASGVELKSIPSHLAGESQGEGLPHPVLRA